MVREPYVMSILSVEFMLILFLAWKKYAGLFASVYSQRRINCEPSFSSSSNASKALQNHDMMKQQDVGKWTKESQHASYHHRDRPSLHPGQAGLVARAALARQRGHRSCHARYGVPATRPTAV